MLDLQTLGPVVTSDTPATARELLRPGLQLWRWERTLPAALAASAARLIAGPVWSVKGTLAADGNAAPIAALLAGAGAPVEEELRLLAADAARQVRLLAGLLGCPRVIVRIECDPDAGCPLFHVDATTARLFCTYAGPGTEWLMPVDADRDELGLGGRSFAAANAAIAVGEVQSLAPGTVAIFKGRLFGGGPEDGLVHRSPDPESGRRLILAVDPADTPGLHPARLLRSEPGRGRRG